MAVMVSILPSILPSNSCSSVRLGFFSLDENIRIIIILIRILATKNATYSGGRRNLYQSDGSKLTG